MYYVATVRILNTSIVTASKYLTDLHNAIEWAKIVLINSENKELAVTITETSYKRKPEKDRGREVAVVEWGKNGMLVARLIGYQTRR